MERTDDMGKWVSDDGVAWTLVERSVGLMAEQAVSEPTVADADPLALIVDSLAAVAEGLAADQDLTSIGNSLQVAVESIRDLI